MSNEDNGAPKRLTLDDPVSPQVLGQLRQIEQTKVSVAFRFLQLEKERVQLLAMDGRLEQENNKLIAMLLAERGLPQNTGVDIDPRTGKIELQAPPPGASPQRPEPPPEEPSEDQQTAG